MKRLLQIAFAVEWSKVYVICWLGGPNGEKGHSFSPYGPTLSRYITYFFFLNLTKFFPKEPEWFKAVNTARSSIQWTIF